MRVRAFCAMPPGYITYATAGAIRDKIRNGEPFDSPQESVVGPRLKSAAPPHRGGHRRISGRAPTPPLKGEGRIAEGDPGWGDSGATNATSQLLHRCHPLPPRKSAAD